MCNFCQISTELWHLIYDPISFPGAILGGGGLYIAWASFRNGRLELSENEVLK